MLARSVNVELPKRVVVFYLLYSLVAVLWLAVSGVLAGQSIAVRNAEIALLADHPQTEPTVVETLHMAGRYALVVLSGPLLLIALGGLSLHRMVRPTRPSMPSSVRPPWPRRSAMSSYRPSSHAARACWVGIESSARCTPRIHKADSTSAWVMPCNRFVRGSPTMS